MPLSGQVAATDVVIRFGRTAQDRAILGLAVPALGALAADPLVSLVDTAFVGRLGADALGALGIAAAVFGVAFALFNFLAYGTTPLIARAVGSGDHAAAGRMAVDALALGAAIGVVSLAVLAGAASSFVTAMGAETSILDGAVQYVRIRALALPAVMLITVGHGVFRGFQDTRTPLVITVGLNAINLVLDPLFIFGLDGGLAGAAWATVAAQWVGAGWFVLTLWRRREVLHIPWDRVSLSGMRRLLGAGRALVVRTSALLGALTLATAIAARVGTVAVAAHQVAAQLWLFLALVVDALAIAGQALIGTTVASEPDRARHVAARLLGLGLLAGLGLGGFMLAGLGVVPSWFTDDPLVVERVRRVYPFVVAMQPLNALVFVWDGIVIGAGDFGYLAGSTVVAALSSVAVLLLVVPLGWGLAGVWWGIAAMMLVRLLAHLRWQRSGPFAA